MSAAVTWTRVIDYEDIRYEHSGTGIAKVTIDRPEVRNAFRPETVAGADRRVRADPRRRLDRLRPPHGCRRQGVLFRRRPALQGPRRLRRRRRAGPRLNVLDLQRQIRSLPIPVIALVNGFAIGGGQVLHVVCDLTIASDNAIFGQVGPRVGSFDAGFGIGLLARLVGDKKAKEIWFLCRRYSAAEALAMGLVNAVVPLADLEAEGVGWADEILAMSPTAIRFLKSAFLVATDGLAGLQEFAGNATGLYYTTDEAHEGSRAFLEKRDPDFSKYPRARDRTRAASRGAPEADAGRRPALRVWLLAIRPATLPAAMSGVAVGLGAALAVGTPFRLDVALGCLAVALLLQVAANLANDLSDFRRGADTPDRTGPIRVAAAGLVTERQLEVAIGIVLGLAGIVGLCLVAVGGRVILVLGALAIVARSRTPAARGRTATAGSARSSSSSSSASSRSSGRRTSRRSAWSRSSSRPRSRSAP